MKKIIILSALILIFTGCAHQQKPQSPQCAEYGTIDYYPQFESEHFASRDVLVWLPEDYTPEGRYGVLYMHDGQMLYDKNTSWNKQSWEVDSLAHTLITEGRTMPFIVVGIYNFDATRLHDYMPRKVFDYLPAEELEDKGMVNPDAIVSDNYLKFLVEELKPFIDSNYPTRPEAEFTAIAGSSAGGLISLYAICEYPEVFGAAACLSTHTPMALSADYEELTKDAPVWSKALRDYLDANQPAANSVKLYMDCGDQTLDAIYPVYQAKVDSLFRAHGWDEEHYMSKVYPGHNHDEKSWKSRFDIPLCEIFRPL